jgi:hypothetical protein
MSAAYMIPYNSSPTETRKARKNEACKKRTAMHACRNVYKGLCDKRESQAQKVL